MKYLLLTFISLCFIQCYTVTLDSGGATYSDYNNDYRNINIGYDEYLGTWEKEYYNLFITLYSDNVYVVCSYKRRVNQSGYIISSTGIFNLFEDRVVLFNDATSMKTEYYFELYGDYSIFNPLPSRIYHQLKGRWIKISTIEKYGWINITPRPRPPFRPPIITNPPGPIIVERPAPPKDKFKPKPRNPKIKKPGRGNKKNTIRKPKPDATAKKKVVKKKEQPLQKTSKKKRVKPKTRSRR